MTNQRGVTLIELMVALSVAAILLSIAIPNFKETIIRNRLNTITNDFIGAINFARSEAIKLGRSVTLCKSNDGSTCSTTNTVFWDQGIIAFSDLDADGTIDSGETILRTWPALSSPYTLRSTAFPNLLRYNAQGTATADGTFAVCHDSAEVGAKTIIITRVRPQSGVDSNNNQIPEAVAGSDITSCEAP
jgi:prepilin-type N-terminal cleavage/methylation domain